MIVMMQTQLYCTDVAHRIVQPTLLGNITNGAPLEMVLIGFSRVVLRLRQNVT